MINVLKPGLNTTLQDLGRPGYRHLGVPQSGMMDSYNGTLANWLVSKNVGGALLEITLAGPHLQFGQDTFIAITGADFTPSLNDAPVPTYKTIEVKKGDILKFNKLEKGCRAYLSVAHKIESPPYLNSMSTYTPGGLGGYKGRALRKDDILPLKKDKISINIKEVPEHLKSKFPLRPTIRFTEGPEYYLLTEESPMGLAEEFTLHQDSDRMGIRLSGFFGEANEKQIISSPVNRGTVQLLPDNNLLIVMADGQVTGGYPRLGNIITADLHILAQLKPGEKVRLSKINLAEARNLYLYQQKLLEPYML